MLNPILDRYDTVLLDMDGVITSEEVYWNAATLTVRELLFSDRYFGAETCAPEDWSNKLQTYRKEEFCDDAVIRHIKQKGINNNWDLSWVVVGGALSQSTRDFQAIFEWITTLPAVKDGLYDSVAEALEKAGFAKEEAAHHGGIWKKIQLAFQEWFLGSELFSKYWDSPSLQPGKPGLTFSEEPIVDKSRLVTLLSEISKAKRLGIGSGRPRVEAENPLRSWGVYDCFTEDAIITYNDILAAQDAINNTVSLAKPHPYMFLRGVFGRKYTDDALFNSQYDAAPCKKTLVIGDAGCDLFSAKSAGCDFLAVLTGIEGEGARGYFEENGADYILSNILELLN